MARRTAQVFHGWNQPEVVVTLPADHEQAGEHPRSLRAWSVDDDTGDW